MVQSFGNTAVAEHCIWLQICHVQFKEYSMSDLVHHVQVRDVEHEFWRPPATQQVADPALADACRRCETEFMVGAAFCHVCGTSRHRADAPMARNWTRYFDYVRALDFAKVGDWFGLALPSLCAFLIGVVFLTFALSVGLISSDFEAVQLWRIQWLIAACAAFLAGILLKSRMPEN
jgi:hypothetical protein